MSRSDSYSMDDDPFFTPSSTLSHTSESHEVRLRNRPPSTTAHQSSRQSGDWSTRLSTSSSGGASSRRDSLPPTRLGVLKPEDTLKVDALRLVKPESNPLSIKAMETINVLEKQKQAQKEIRRYSNTDESDVDWEKNLSSWKDRRKSKPTFHLKALEIGDDDTEDSSQASGKKSKTYKELMEQKEKRSNGHGMYTFEDEHSSVFEPVSTASSKHDSQLTTAGTKYGDRLKQSEPLSEAAPAKAPDVGSYSTSRYNFTEVSAKTCDGEPRPTSGHTSGYRSDVGYGSRDGHSGRVGLPAEGADGESYSTSRYNFTEVPAKASDVKPHASSRQTSSGVSSELGYGTRTSNLTRSTVERERDQRQPYELTVDLQVPSTKPTTNTTDLAQKRTSAESVRPLSAEPETDRRSTRQKPETSTTVKTTTTFEVKLREKPNGSQPQPRPASYTPSTRQPDTFLKLDAGRPAPRTEVTARLPGSSSNRDSFTSRQLDKTPGPSADSTNRDRRVKSAWEMNFDRTFSTDRSNRPELRQPQRPIAAEGSSPSSSRFKQTLSLFQSKEAGTGNVGPVKAPPPPLATQRSVGRISQLPVEDFKTGYRGVETRRGSAAAERKYQPITETTSSYKTDAARLRGVSRSVQGLDMHRSDFGIPDVKNPVPQRDFLSRDRDEKYGLGKLGTKAELSGANNVEISSSAVHSSDDEREKISRTPSGKIQADVDMPEVQESRRMSQFGLVADKPVTELRSARRHDANGLSESSGVGVTSSHSRKETHVDEPQDRVVGKHKETQVPQESISVTRYSSSQDARVHDKPTSVAGGHYLTPSTDVADSNKQTVSHIRRDDDQRTTRVGREEITIRTSKTEGDTRMSRGTESLKLNETKELYAYKHRSPFLDESVTANADAGKQTIKRDEATRRQDESYLDTKGSHFASHKTEPTIRYDIKESYGRNDYRKTDTTPRIHEGDVARKPSRVASYPVTSEDPEEQRLSGLKSYQHQKPTQQTSISDIFSKRSAAAVGGKSVGAEPEPHFAPPSDSRKAVEATPSGMRAESPAEREMTRRFEAAVDETIKEFRQEADMTAKTKTTSAIADDVIETKIKDRKDEPFRRTDYDVTSVSRTSRDPYDSSRRHYGLERTAYTAAEPVSERYTIELEKPLSHRGVTLGDVKQEEKTAHHQHPAFEVNFAVSEVETQRRSREIQMGKGNFESVVLDRDKNGENADFRRFDDSLLIKTPNEEKRLAGDQKTALAFHEKGITLDQKNLFEDQKISVGAHKTTAYDQKASLPQDSFHRSETESIRKLDVTGDSRSDKKTLTGDWENTKNHRNEFHLEVDTGGLLLDRNSPEQRMPAVSLATQPTTLRRGLQQELILEFPEPRMKESTKREVNETADDFYFGMTGGTSGDTLQPKNTAKPAKPLVEIPTQEHRSMSQIHLLPSQEHKLMQQEDQLTSEEQHKLQSLKHELPSHGHKLSSEEHELPSVQHRLSPLPSQERKLPSDENRSPLLEHRLSPLASQERKLPSDENISPLLSPEHKVQSEEHRLPSEEHRLPSQEHRLSTREEKSSSQNRTAEFGLVIDLDNQPGVQRTAEKSTDKIIIPQLDILVDDTRFDMNSNIPMDTKQTSPPARSTTTLLEELQDPWAFDSSQAKPIPETTVFPTSVDKNRLPDKPNELLTSSALGEGESAMESDAKTSPASKKRPPPPKTKPKPKASKVSDDQLPESDEWGFLPSSQRLDVSASKDKCRLLKTGAMGARRRPKSAVFPLLETSDPFNLPMITDQNGPSNKDTEDHRKNLVPADTDPASVPALVEPLTATRLKSKVRPVSYMEELNSSLFKKKMEGGTSTDDDEFESKHPSITRSKEEFTLMSGLSSASIRQRKDAADEEDGKLEGPVTQLESGGAEKARPGVRVRVPGLMDELNISLKKKRHENLNDSREEEEMNTERKPVSAEVATGDLLNFADDKYSNKDDDDEEYDAPPPPLPDAPPPVPKWSAFPASSSSDLGPPSGPPSGPPPGPPPALPLIDLSFAEEEPGHIHFRTTGMSSNQSHLQLDGNHGKAFPSSAPDDMDFSLA